MRYAISVTSAAQKDIEKLADPAQTQVRKTIRLLADNPRPSGAIKMEGFKGLYRVRSGAYRIVYAIQDSQLLILVTAVGNRRDVYSLLKRRINRK